MYKLRQHFVSKASHPLDLTPLAALWGVLLTVYANPLSRKLFTRIYKSALAIESKFVVRPFQKLAVLVGKCFCVIGRSCVRDASELAVLLTEIYAEFPGLGGRLFFPLRRRRRI